MRDLDMLDVLTEFPPDMTARQRQFVAEMCLYALKGKPLSPAQHQYLQSIYDLVIAFRYGLEPMAGEREYAASRAIARNMRGPRREK